MENLELVDLWGNRVYRTTGKRGRPPFQWTEENSRKISMLLAMGWNNARIAGCVLDPRTGKPISEPTLKRYFRSELAARDHARDRFDAWRLERTMQEAAAGNMSAMKHLDKLVEKNDLMGASAKLADAQARRAKAEAKSKAPVGKKEAAQQAAAQAAGEDSGDWGGDLAVPGFGRPN